MKDERTSQVIKNYKRLHDEGYSISQIAEMYQLSKFTIYRHLSTIAEREGVSRESLLEKPFFADHSGRYFAPVKPIESKALLQKCDDILKAISSLRTEIQLKIKEMEE